LRSVTALYGNTKTNRPISWLVLLATLLN